MAKATTVRFSEEVYQRLDQASARTGMPVNSIVVAACLEWLQRHTPVPGVEPSATPMPFVMRGPPRWSTIQRAMRQAVRTSVYPFERFSDHAKTLLTLSQSEATSAGFSYIGTEHLLLAAFGKPEFHSARVLSALGVAEESVRTTIKNVIGQAPRLGGGGIIPTSRVKKVIEIAFEVCGTLDTPHVGTDHILLALALEGKGIAAHVLEDLGASTKRIEVEVRRIGEPET